MNILLAKIIGVIVLIITSFVVGWSVKGAFVAKRDLAIIEAKNEFIDAYKSAEADKANILENKLGELKANEKTIERERIKIVDRPVYSNECLDADGLRLIESARTGKADTIESTSEVPTAK
jgi:hypothetical protein